MRKAFLGVAACALLMTSCSNESDLLNVGATISGLMTRAVANDEDFQIVNYDGEPCVQFKNDSAYKAVLDKIANLSNDEMISFFSRDGFISQKQLMKEADQEQEQIVDNYEKDPSQPFPHKQIRAFKQKYNDVFMFEPYDSTNFIAHYKLKELQYSAFTGKDGTFLIGDSVIYAPVYNSPEEYFGSGIVLYADEERSDEKYDTNTAYAQIKPADADKSKRLVKIRAKWYFSGEKIVIDRINNVDREYKYQEIKIDFLSQKKKILWKKHRATIYVRLTATGSGPNGLEVIYADAGIQKPSMPFLIEANVYDEWTMRYGRVGENEPGSIMQPVPYRYTLNGRMEIWSNEIPEAKKGTAKLDLKTN